MTTETLKLIAQKLEDLTPEYYVKLHQNSFKNHYLRWDDNFTNYLLKYDMNVEDEEFNSEIYEILMDFTNVKYTEFFKNMRTNSGIEKVVEWNNDDLTAEELNGWIDSTSNDERVYEVMAELTDDMVSGVSLNHIALEIVEQNESDFDKLNIKILRKKKLDKLNK